MTRESATNNGNEPTSKSDEADRLCIRDAMDRLLAGTPLHSDGKLTIKSLAVEAQVKRWMLTHRHVDLQDEFRARVAQQGNTPEAVQTVMNDNAALSNKVSELIHKLTIERETVKRLERVVQVLTLELESLRHNAQVGKVRAIRKGPGA